MKCAARLTILVILAVLLSATVFAQSEDSVQLTQGKVIEKIFNGDRPVTFYFNFWKIATFNLSLSLQTTTANKQVTIDIISWTPKSSDASDSIVKSIPQKPYNGQLKQFYDEQQSDFPKHCNSSLEYCYYNVTITPASSGTIINIKLDYIYSGTGNKIQELGLDLTRLNIECFDGPQYANGVYSYRYFVKMQKGDERQFRIHFNSLTAHAIILSDVQDASKPDFDMNQLKYPIPQPQDLLDLQADTDSHQYSVYDSKATYLYCVPQFTSCVATINVIVQPNAYHDDSVLQAQLSDLNSLTPLNENVESESYQISSSGQNVFQSIKLNISSDTTIPILSLNAQGCYTRKQIDPPQDSRNCVFQFCVVTLHKLSCTDSAFVQLNLEQQQVNSFSQYYVIFYGVSYPVATIDSFKFKWYTTSLQNSLQDYTNWDSVTLPLEKQSYFRYRINTNDTDNTAFKLYSKYDASDLKFQYNICQPNQPCYPPTDANHNYTKDGTSQNPIVLSDKNLPVGTTIYVKVSDSKYNPTLYQLPSVFQADFYSQSNFIPDDSQANSKMSGWEITGIVLLSLIGAGSIAFAVKYFLDKKRVKDQGNQSVYSEEIR